MDDAAAVVDALKARFPEIVGPKKDDICYATQNRQDAVKVMVPKVDAVIVVGSPNSSNSNRLREVAANRGVPAYMVDHADELAPGMGCGQASRRRHRRSVRAGSAGAQVIARLKELGALGVTELSGIVENVTFPLPKGWPGNATAKAPEVGPPRDGHARTTFTAARARRETTQAVPRRSLPQSPQPSLPPRHAARIRSTRASAFREIKRQQQRQPLPWPAIAARDTREQDGERQRLQRQPRTTRGLRRQHDFPQQLEQRQRGQSDDGPARARRGLSAMARPRAAVIRRR